MAKPFKGTINVDIRDSEPDWTPFEPPVAPYDAPNVVYIVLDDVGFGGMSRYGGPIDTPNIDRIAAQEVRYTQWHTTALCSPTRSCLLTGRNHTRAETNQWHPDLIYDNHPVDQPRSPEQGYHFTEDITDKALGIVPQDTELPPVNPMGTPESHTDPAKPFPELDTTKRYEFNGGTADPCIFSWPGGMRGRGEIRHQYHHAIDIVPTILDALSIEPPETIKGYTQSHFDGASMRYALDDASEWHHFGSDTWELYHTDTDRSECHNLAAQEPERLRDLINLWYSEAGANGAFPLDDHGPIDILTTPRPATGCTTSTTSSAARNR
jgi:arylsulfatase A-like enzyme